ncbi:MAG: MBL fold metallo-hydrolase [Verrucomicrobiota bacterium]
MAGNSSVRFRSLCRAPEIGSNSYQLSFGELNFVLDTGMHPKQEGLNAIPRYDLLDHDSVDAIFVTHAHLDHLGTLPVLQRDQPHSRVYMTPEVVDLADAMLHNSVNVMMSQRSELGIDAYPLFTHNEIEDFGIVWQGRDYRKPFEPVWDSGIKATFRDAGHVMGSAGILFEGLDKKVFYTGDVQFNNQTLIQGADFDDLPPLDALIIETTRGNSPHLPGFSRIEQEQRLIEDLNRTLDRNGTVLIPVFAMGKTQEVLTMIQNAKESGALHDVPVTIGGLSTKMTVIYDRYSNSPNRSRPDFKILRDMDLNAGTRRRGRPIPIKSKPRAIFALSSGMMSENTVSNNFARPLLSNPNNSIHFVGYSDPSTPAYRVRNATRGEKVCLDERLPKVPLECNIYEYDFSGHADREDLLQFILKTNPKQAFLVHGDPQASQWFKEQLQSQAPHIEVHIPAPKVEFVL